jgi:hypothetical protein
MIVCADYTSFVRSFKCGLLNSLMSRRMFGMVTNAGKLNSAASFSQQIRPASAEVWQIFSARL